MSALSTVSLDLPKALRGHKSDSRVTGSVNLVCDHPEHAHPVSIMMQCTTDTHNIYTATLP